MEAEREIENNKSKKKKRLLKDKILEMNYKIIQPLLIEVFTKDELI